MMQMADEERYVVVEHNGTGPGHRTFMVRDNLTKAQAEEFVANSNRRRAIHSKVARNIFVHAYRKDGRYDLML